jgi:hypothetical protein
MDGISSVSGRLDLLGNEVRAEAGYHRYFTLGYGGVHASSGAGFRYRIIKFRTLQILKFQMKYN